MNANRPAARRRAERRAEERSITMAEERERLVQRLEWEAASHLAGERLLLSRAGSAPDGLPAIWRTVDGVRIQRQKVRDEDLAQAVVRYLIDDEEFVVPFGALRDGEAHAFLFALSKTVRQTANLT